jgi:hypothetical protein
MKATSKNLDFTAIFQECHFYALSERLSVMILPRGDFKTAFFLLGFLPEQPLTTNFLPSANAANR